MTVVWTAAVRYIKAEDCIACGYRPSLELNRSLSSSLILAFHIVVRLAVMNVHASGLFLGPRR